MGDRVPATLNRKIPSPLKCSTRNPEMRLPRAGVVVSGLPCASNLPNTQMPLTVGALTWAHSPVGWAGGSSVTPAADQVDAVLA